MAFKSHAPVLTVIPGSMHCLLAFLGRLYVVMRFKQGSAACKENTLTPILSLWLPLSTFNLGCLCIIEFD